MVERRDRARRQLLPVEEAAPLAGTCEPGSPELAGLLDRIETGGARAIATVLAGGFPVQGEERRALALYVAVSLVLGPGHREERTRANEVLEDMIRTGLGEALEGDEPQTEEEEEAEPAGVMAPEAAFRLQVAGMPGLARAVAARTWQLVRFPAPALLTGDTAVTLWRRPGPPGDRWGLGTTDEVRFPLDPRHALIVALHAPAGEVVRDVGERHARALNRTVAEGCREWFYYHPASDPLDAVELAPPDPDD